MNLAISHNHRLVTGHSIQQYFLNESYWLSFPHTLVIVYFQKYMRIPFRIKVHGYC